MKTPAFRLPLRFIAPEKVLNEIESTCLKIVNKDYAGARCDFTFGLENDIPVIIVSNLGTPDVDEHVILSQPGVQKIMRDRLGPQGLARFLQFMNIPNVIPSDTAAERAAKLWSRAAEATRPQSETPAPFSGPQLVPAADRSEGRYVVIKLKNKMESDEYLGRLFIHPNEDLLSGMPGYPPIVTHPDDNLLVCCFVRREKAERVAQIDNLPSLGIESVAVHPTAPEGFYSRKGPGIRKTLDC